MFLVLILLYLETSSLALEKRCSDDTEVAGINKKSHDHLRIKMLILLKSNQYTSIKYSKYQY